MSCIAWFRSCCLNNTFKHSRSRKRRIRPAGADFGFDTGGVHTNVGRAPHPQVPCGMKWSGRTEIKHRNALWFAISTSFTPTAPPMMAFSSATSTSWLSAMLRIRDSSSGFYEAHIDQRRIQVFSDFLPLPASAYQSSGSPLFHPRRFTRPLPISSFPAAVIRQGHYRVDSVPRRDRPDSGKPVYSI